MFNYVICCEPDKELFKKQCNALEKHIPNIQKHDLLKDVDDSETQIYSLNGKTITVHNSYYIGSLYIESEVKLEPYFNSSK